MVAERPTEPAPSDAEDLFTEWLARGGQGEPAFEELCRSHPRAEPELRKLWRDWRRFEGVRAKASLGSALAASAGTPASAVLQRLAAKRPELPRYQLRGELARGAMGAILRVWDEDLQRNLAMKVILGQAQPRPSGETPPVESQVVARFLEEAQITGQLDHPGIVPVHELGVDASGRVFFTMKLVQGRDLKTIFERVFAAEEGWSETRAVGVLLKVCEALAYAHSKGVIHRDLKPSNVMVGNFGEVYVMDWGLARVLDRADSRDIRIRPEGGPASVHTERRTRRASEPDSSLQTMDGDVLGTPAYMPPEQARGEIQRMGPRSDVYAVGAMLYHLLTRAAPYSEASTKHSPHAILARVVAGAPRPIAELRGEAPRELVAICEQAMAREPEERYAEPLALAQDLRAYLEGRVVHAHDTSAWMQARKWVRRNRMLAGSLAAAMALLFFALFTMKEQRVEAALRTKLESELLAGRLVEDLTRLREDDLFVSEDELDRGLAEHAPQADVSAASDRSGTLSLDVKEPLLASLVLRSTPLQRAEAIHRGLGALGFDLAAATEPGRLPLLPTEASAVQRALFDVLTHSIRHLARGGAGAPSGQLPDHLVTLWSSSLDAIGRLQLDPWRQALGAAYLAWWREAEDRTGPLLERARDPEFSGEDLELLAELLAEVGHDDEATRLYRTALDRDPERLLPHVRLMERSRGVERAGHFLQTLQEHESGAAWLDFATSLQTNILSARDLQIAAYRHAITLAPTLTNAYTNLSQLLPPEEGVVLLEELILSGNGSADCYVSLTALVSALGRNEDWIRYAEEGVERFPEHGKLRFNLARAYDHTGRLEEALTEYEATAEIGDDASWEAHTNAGSAWQRILFAEADLQADDPRLERALEHYERALELRPRDPTSLFNVASALINAVELDGALENLEQVAALVPDFPRLKDALDAIHAFVSSNPDYAEFLPRVEALRE